MQLKQKYLDSLLKRINYLKVFKTGDFVLSSGEKSDFYFDGRLLTLDPESLFSITQLFLEIIKERKIRFIGGPATGAIPIVSAIVLHSYQYYERDAEGLIFGFFVRDNEKQYGTGNIIEGHLLEKSNVIIIDDTLTTGNSILKTIEQVEKKKCKIKEVLTVLDRNENGKIKLNNSGYKVTSLLTYNRQNRSIEPSI